MRATSPHCVPTAALSRLIAYALKDIDQLEAWVLAQAVAFVPFAGQQHHRLAAVVLGEQGAVGGLEVRDLTDQPAAALVGQLAELGLDAVLVAQAVAEDLELQAPDRGDEGVAERVLPAAQHLHRALGCELG